MTDDNFIEREMMEAPGQELDALISEVFKRQAVLETVHEEVMTGVRQHSRRILLRRWLRVAAFAFGVPFILLCYAFGLYQILLNGCMQQPYMWVVIMLPTITILAFLNKALKDFSINQV